VPYPTPRPFVAEPSRQPHTVIDMGGRIGALDLALHPTEGWPLLVAVQWGWSHDSYGDGRVLAVVHEMAGDAWGLTQSLNLAPVRQSAGGIAAAISPDGRAHVVFGDGGGPTAGRNHLWHVFSDDAGRSWSLPAPLGDGDALDMVADSSGRLHLLARLREGGETSRLAYATLEGQQWRWGSPPLGGDRLRGTILALPLPGGATRIVVAAPSRDGSRLDVALRDDHSPAWHTRQLPTGRFLREETIMHVAGLAALTPDNTPLVAIAWSQYSQAGVFATLSHDGGASWGEQELIAFQPDRTAAGWGGWQPTLALDHSAQRLLAFWTLRAFDRPELPWLPVASTRPLDSSTWLPALGPGAPQPTALLPSVDSAATLSSATAPGARTTWLAWTESRDGRVEVASLAHDLVVGERE
jgi:hypothetical protein